MSYDRSGARAGQDVILSTYFTQNGEGADVYSIGSVEIYDPLDSLIATISSEDIENVTGVNGLYKITYSVPTGLEEGTWRDVWKDIKVTPIAEYIDSTQYFFVVPETQAIPGSNTVVVYTYAKDANGNAKEGIYGYAEIVDPPFHNDGAYFANPTDRGIRATSDANGLLEWTIPQTARMRFWIDDIDLKIEKTAPSGATTTALYDLEDF
jgi:hypothetical protein